MFKIIFGVALIVYLKRLSGKGCNRELWLQQYIGFPLLILQHRPVVCETGCCGRAAVCFVHTIDFTVPAKDHHH